MHARRALPGHALAAPRVRFGHVLTAVWATCLVLGLLMLANFGYGMWSGVSEQNHLNQVWQYQAGPPITPPPVIDPKMKRPLNGIDFAIQIPKLHYFAAVKEGVDSGVLYAGPGHYPTTRWPGDPGTVGVAAHNVYWINFPQLKPGDEIDIQTRYGLYRYRLTDTAIVNPDNRTALIADANGYYLTLTTCWPLWAGAFATQRYIIHATQYWPVPVRPGYL
jgi:LPXTG-site transpeptidase (sortase) family protein